MKFDINKVYTAVNADEVKIGSKCFYEWSLKYLKEAVKNNNEQDIGIVTEIYDESQIYRFQIDYCIDREEISDGAFALIYLIEPPKEKNTRAYCGT
ncbi:MULTISPECIES: hypothetical protein [unclassified Treponema]|uniref:hypothetical protein n=1 Tax=unclassified Treponema TaxID=2638727 RepID=UPI0020A5E45A|nr:MULTISPECIES: hypothetical protein [unclassified Treponema]UTC65993.1 hypothetical protein E4O06_08145 [Treponema sp. OMZ 789]UTC68723.1 hypothetical protein E4O01_08285 [Treponema sp. OMZ 790]UTC71453.1 hypothetical protein E4O02_08480 [Treponema sp. OMZ 791]